MNLKTFNDFHKPALDQIAYQDLITDQLAWWDTALIPIGGGTYDDWLDAVYTHERAKSIENPVYHGSLIKELMFEEVISNSETDVNGDKKPLGTLGGRGRLTQKHKGGKAVIKVNEPS